MNEWGEEWIQVDCCFYCLFPGFPPFKGRFPIKNHRAKLPQAAKQQSGAKMPITKRTYIRRDLVFYGAVGGCGEKCGNDQKDATETMEINNIVRCNGFAHEFVGISSSNSLWSSCFLAVRFFICKLSLFCCFRKSGKKSSTWHVVFPVASGNEILQPWKLTWNLFVLFSKVVSPCRGTFSDSVLMFNFSFHVTSHGLYLVTHLVSPNFWTNNKIHLKTQRNPTWYGCVLQPLMEQFLGRPSPQTSSYQPTLNRFFCLSRCTFRW